jgi:hypothetical protein
MKYLILVFTSLFISNMALSQETKTYELSKFDELIVIGNFPVEIVHSDRKEAIVEKHSDEVDLSNLSFSYTNSTLTIKYSGSFVETIDIHLVLYYPNAIPNIEARRGAEIRVSEAGEFDSSVSFKVDSGSKLLIKNITAPLIKAEVTKGGSIRLTGKTEIFEPTVKTGGTIGAAQLKAKEVNASIIFGGEIICAPVQLLNAKVNSGGTISYTGKPEVKEKITFGGTIEKI